MNMQKLSLVVMLGALTATNQEDIDEILKGFAYESMADEADAFIDSFGNNGNFKTALLEYVQEQLSEYRENR